MAHAASRPTVLVVDDDDAVLQSLSDVLDYIGYAVALAPSVAIARQVLAGGLVDLLLADMRLPDGRGSDLVAQAAVLGVPCVLMSGDPDADARPPSAAFLAKPFSITQLGAEMHRHLPPGRVH